MSKLVTIRAFRNSSVNGLACIFQTLHVFFRGWPSFCLLWASGIRRPAPLDGVFLIKITLEVHVGQSHGELSLQSNQVDSEVLASEGLLQGGVSSIRVGFDVLISSFLDVIQIVVGDGSAKLLPSNLTRDIFDSASVDLAMIFTGGGIMALYQYFSVCPSRKIGKRV